GEPTRTMLADDDKSTRMVVSPTSRPRSAGSAARATGADATGGCAAGGCARLGGADIGIGVGSGSGAYTVLVHDSTMTAATSVVPNASAGRRRSATNLLHRVVEAIERFIDVGVAVGIGHERGLECGRREIHTARQRGVKESLEAFDV